MPLMSFLILVILFLAFFVFFSGINPQEMTIFYLPDQSLTYPVAVIVIGCILIGLFLGYAFHLYGALTHGLRSWMRQRQDKKHQEVATVYRQGVSRLLSGDNKKAATLLQKALERDPNRLDTHLALANVYLQQGDGHNALTMLHKAKSLDPNSLEAHFKLAVTYEELGQDQDAIQEYDEILGIERDNRKALRALRDLHMKRENWTQAEELQKRVLKVGPSSNRLEEEKRIHLSIRYELARQALEQGEAGQAKATLKQLAKEDPKFTPARVTLGDAFLAGKSINDALQTWQDGYLALGRSVFLCRLEDTYMEQEDPKSLLSFYSKALNEHPNDLLLHFFYGKLCLRLEMVDQALEQIYAVENAGADFPELHLLLAEAHRRRNRIDEAINEYQQALGVDNRLRLTMECDVCGARAAEWQSRCPDCGTWGSFGTTFREQIRRHKPVKQTAIHHGERVA